MAVTTTTTTITIKTLSEEILKPSSPVHVPFHECMLSSIDRIGRNMFVPLAWFFKHDLQDKVFLALIKDALADALSFLPVFASRIHVSSTTGRFSAKGTDGIEFIVATTNNTLADFLPDPETIKSLDHDSTFGTRLPRSLASVFHPNKPVTIHPYIENSLPVTSVVVTSIPADNAMAISIHIGHIIADASTISSLLTRWSENIRIRLNANKPDSTPITPAPPTPIPSSLHDLIASFAVTVPEGVKVESKTFRPIDSSWFSPPKEQDSDWQQGETPLDVQVVPLLLTIPTLFVTRLKDAIMAKISKSVDTTNVFVSHIVRPSRDPNVPCTQHRPTNLRPKMRVSAETPGNLILNLTTLLPSVSQTPLHVIARSLRTVVLNVDWKTEMRYLVDNIDNDLWYASDIVRDGQPDFVISSWTQFGILYWPPNVGQIMLEGDEYKIQIALFNRDVDAFKRILVEWEKLPESIL
ncbi:hypothetical protein BC829DRAFT_388815 [Chytridium lagenaria]|nr:hypothetical protein BC829DRAFT_388815 [Chytridium lagenaria]